MKIIQKDMNIWPGESLKQKRYRHIKSFSVLYYYIKVKIIKENDIVKLYHWVMSSTSKANF